MTATRAARLAALHAAEAKALALLDRIEAEGLIAPGRTERAVEQAIYPLAKTEFGVTRHWHKRICRCGENARCTARDNPPVLTIAEDDLVYLDLGPVFAAWEADVGRSYAIGGDPAKHALVADLPRGFDALQARYRERHDVTGADLYAFACDWAAQHGWRFGGVIAGHVVGEFPHAHLPGERDLYRINPDNRGRLRDPDPLGQDRFWIGEIHLVAPDGSFAGFYERLLD